MKRLKDHPYISAEELAYIQESQTESFTVKPVIPWKDIFSSLPVWAVIIAHLGNAYALVLLLAEMPTYFRQVLHLDIQTDGLLSAIPYAGQMVSSATSSYIADRLRMSNKISITSIRKIMNSIGVLYGITCTIANAGGIASPQIAGVITASGKAAKQLLSTLLRKGCFFHRFRGGHFSTEHQRPDRLPTHGPVPHKAGRTAHQRMGTTFATDS
ncbi:vesicular glutamate transporter 2.1 [Caerostris extrusa]|uniref:Vesicular glutamate transporter 2.1 n=1 Tax=Caerostris extrusa TaxID=172846 RepID=A0AAV4Q0W2_CAEEX|nr:vesicular glutamate transporter 2.1 [Caerostris extrusa]